MFLKSSAHYTEKFIAKQSSAFQFNLKSIEKTNQQMVWPLKPRPLLFFVEVVSFVCCLSMHEALFFDCDFSPYVF